MTFTYREGRVVYDYHKPFLLRRLRYPEFFGGAIMMTHQNIDKINGFCNILYGWGGEDDNIFLRYVPQRFHNYLNP